MASKDDGADKAYEAAAGGTATATPKAAPKKPKAPAKPKAEPEAKAEPVTEPAVAAKVEETPAPAAKPAVAKPVSKPALKTSTAKAAVAKRTAKKTPVKKTPAKKAASKPTPAKARVAKPAATKAAVKKTVAAPAAKIAAVASEPAKITTKITQEFSKMTTPEAFTKGFQTAVADMQTKSKEAYEKSTAMMGEATEFTKGNFEAMVESGKILASGMQEMGRGFVADSKAEFEALTAEVKELAAVKSPTDFFQLQSAMMRKYFDKSVAAASKNTEAMLKLANDAAQPLSSRVSLAMEKVKAA